VAYTSSSYRFAMVGIGGPWKRGPERSGCTRRPKVRARSVSGLNASAMLKGVPGFQVRLDRLEQGNFGDCKPVGEGVLELRVEFSPGYRVYFAENGPRIVLLLIGGDKSSQATNIKTAKNYWLD
jgi:putative addiction module killer protein